MAHGDSSERDIVVDLNADLGEGLGDDEAMLGFVTSANIACGFHAGDAATMRHVCDIAAERTVSVGAHVSYRDRENFGRVRVDVTPGVLTEQVLEQIETLADIARQAGSTVRYVKPHGALYNVSAYMREQADAIALAVSQCDPSLMLLGLRHSQLEVSAMRRDIGFVSEAFADRAYLSDGRLVPRDQPGAVLEQRTDVIRQGLGIARGKAVLTGDGARVEVVARSICVHGDTPGAVAMAGALREALVGAGIVLAPFAV
jgi:UPF0271 protein